ncbi:LysR family transcriptional regulator ArgP [Massilia sp. W12]|uniref:LysR family transcriptional regulator ArgP n=1 Tax=Massilia sp. W12 TaxID=3126507 RepID=UPI0030D5E1B7
MFDSRKTEALLAVFDTGSFEMAARELHLTPSAVSQRISALEQELGAPLVLRGKPCRPSATGQRVLRYLRQHQMLEAELRTELFPAAEQPTRIALALNNDTLATWLLPALAGFLQREAILLDILLDDQEHTFKALEQGLALAGVAARAQAMRGGMVQPLGRMRYHLLATPEFAARWFGAGLQRQALRQAPLLSFDRKDMLQADFLQQHFGLGQGSYPVHFIPASSAYFQALRLGLGYGLIPELQSGPLQESGLIDLAPDKTVDVMLYWHAWKLQSPRLQNLGNAILDAARRVLLPPLAQTEE